MRLVLPVAAALLAGCGPGPQPLTISGPAERLEVAGAEAGSVAFRETFPEPRSAVVGRTGGEVRALFDESEFVTTDSGLRYAILDAGGGEPPAADTQVLVHYTGVLEDGTPFDSSAGKRRPVKLRLSGVIAGWTEGLQLIGRGGRILLICPPGLAYGENGSPPDIPPDATLYFDVELFKIL